MVETQQLDVIATGGDFPVRREPRQAVGSRNEFEIASAELLKALFPMQKAVRLLGVSISGFKLDEIRRAEQIALGLQSNVSPLHRQRPRLDSN